MKLIYIRNVALIGTLFIAVPSVYARQQAPKDQASRTNRLGVQGLALAGMNWPAHKDSFEAVGLDSKPLEVGGGARVSGLWKNLFVQVSAARWSSDGERVFVASDGTLFPLGIPLTVRSTYIDASIGWESLTGSSSSGNGVLTYIGGGMGAVRYSETSPFAQAEDDLKTQKASFHVMGGVDVPLLPWLGITGDVRFRFVPGLLGEGGVSEALGREGFHGLQTSVGLRFGLRAQRAVPSDRSSPSPSPVRPQTETLLPEPQRGGRANAVILQTARVYLLPDSNRTPLRTLDAGTTVQVLEATEEWVRIAFDDAVFGRRIGYVQRAYVQIPE